jgi:DNA-binding transcriptional MerR regulator
VSVSREDRPGPLRAAPRREFYSIGEVCSMLGLKPYVLRYWETQFEDLAPSKNRSGNRVYRLADVQRIAHIQRLVHEERYTIDGARQRLRELVEEGGGAEAPAGALERSFLRALRSDLEEVLEMLEDEPAAGSRR